MKQLFSLILLVLAVSGSALAQTGTAQFTVQELLRVRRVGDPQVSPDGARVAFTIGDVNKTANRVVTQIYIVSINGGTPLQLTTGDRSNVSPRWSPDGRRLAFVSGGQIYTVDANNPADQKQITRISTGAGNPVWSPDGAMIAFVSDVYPECNGDDACNKNTDEKAESSKVQAKVTDRLLFRHWNEWRDRKRTHLFVAASDGGSAAREITSGDYDAPPYGASGFADYAFSPDSKELVFLRNPDKVEAVSTNSDVYTVSVSGGEPRNITVNNRGYDASPVYSPDGKFLAYRSQATAGFEADRWRLMLFDRQTGQSRELTTGFDLQVEEFAFAPDGKTIYFTALERARAPIYAVPTTGNARPRKFAEAGLIGDLRVARDGRLVFSRNDGRTPPEIARLDANGDNLRQLTTVNADQMRGYNLQPLEDFDWTGANGAKVHGLITKPANFDPNKKYPLFVLIHGGPQSASNDSWSYRWNSQIYANRGYIVFSPNPRGSVGYGQQFVNDISGDWGGKVYVDLMNGVAELVDKNKYIDRERIGAGGASYGGYMVNWILGHNTDPRFRFKALLSHAGVYNLESMYGATEELWFVNQDFGGAPWQKRDVYEKFSPHKFAQNFKTPTLVTHGELDYRVPIGEGLQLYTALQLNNIESKLIYFPDEGHWILKPQNSEFWYTNVLDWFDKHLQSNR